MPRGARNCCAPCMRRRHPGRSHQQARPSSRRISNISASTTVRRVGAANTPWLKPDPQLTAHALATLQADAPPPARWYSRFDAERAQRRDPGFFVTTGTHSPKNFAPGAELVFPDLPALAREAFALLPTSTGPANRRVRSMPQPVFMSPCPRSARSLAIGQRSSGAAQVGQRACRARPRSARAGCPPQFRDLALGAGDGFFSATTRTRGMGISIGGDDTIRFTRRLLSAIFEEVVYFRAFPARSLSITVGCGQFFSIARCTQGRARTHHLPQRENTIPSSEFRCEDSDGKVTIVGTLPGVQCGRPAPARQ